MFNFTKHRTASLHQRFSINGEPKMFDSLAFPSSFQPGNIPQVHSTCILCHCSASKAKHVIKVIDIQTEMRTWQGKPAVRPFASPGRPWKSSTDSCTGTRGSHPSSCLLRITRRQNSFFSTLSKPHVAKTLQIFMQHVANWVHDKTARRYPSAQCFAHDIVPAKLVEVNPTQGKSHTCELRVPIHQLHWRCCRQTACCFCPIKKSVD